MQAFFLPLLLAVLLPSSSTPQTQGSLQTTQPTSNESLRLKIIEAEKGDANAQYELGTFYSLGLSRTPKDPTTAAKWFQKAADQGHAGAQFMLGMAYKSGKGVPKDVSGAAKYFALAAKQKDRHAQLALGFLYFDGLGVPQDYIQAYVLGNLVLVNGVQEGSILTEEVTRKLAPPDLALAQAKALEAVNNEMGIKPSKAVHSSSDQQPNLGSKERRLQELTKQYKNVPYPDIISSARNGFADARDFIIYKAQQGDMEAQYWYGGMIFYGNGIPKDQPEGVKWIMKSANQGYASAELLLGECYDYGDGVQKNRSEAIKWWESAAKHNDYKAMGKLGDYYCNRNDGGKNINEAIKWYIEASKNELLSITEPYKLGEIYEFGNGVNKNISEAIKWYKISAKRGYSPAVEKIQNIEISKFMYTGKSDDKSLNILIAKINLAESNRLDSIYKKDKKDRDLSSLNDPNWFLAHCEGKNGFNIVNFIVHAKSSKQDLMRRASQFVEIAKNNKFYPINKVSLIFIYAGLGESRRFFAIDLTNGSTKSGLEVNNEFRYDK